MRAFKRLPGTAAFFFIPPPVRARVFKDFATAILALIFCTPGSSIHAQVSMLVKLPTVLHIDSNYIFETRIRKGTSTDYSRYLLELPPGVSVSPVNTNSGSFSADAGKVKVTWPITPVEAELQLSFNIRTGTLTGVFSVMQWYEYVSGGEKKQVEIQPLSVTISNTMAIEPAAPQFTLLNQHVVAGLPKLETQDAGAKNSEELRHQVDQLRNDARDAREAGTREKALAEPELAAAVADLQRAEQIRDPSRRREAVNKAQQARLKAENNLAIGLKIVELADRLDANANEIEGLGTGANKDGKPADQAVQPSVAAMPPETPKTNELSGALYRVQIGAFARDPDRNAYEKLGQVTILNDKGLYKVLIGNYSNREEAQKKKEELSQRGIQGFVVAYSDAVSR